MMNAIGQVKKTQSINESVSISPQEQCGNTGTEIRVWNIAAWVRIPLYKVYSVIYTLLNKGFYVKPCKDKQNEGLSKTAVKQLRTYGKKIKVKTVKGVPNQSVSIILMN